GSAQRDSSPVGLERRWHVGHLMVDDEDGNAHFQLCGRLHGRRASNRLGRPHREQVPRGFGYRCATAAEWAKPRLHADGDATFHRERVDFDHNHHCNSRNRLCGESLTTHTWGSRLNESEVTTLASTSSSLA